MTKAMPITDEAHRASLAEAAAALRDALAAMRASDSASRPCAPVWVLPYARS
jgi:hypothetical protein